MEHLTLEALARLVDTTPTAEEATHIGACARCARELGALRDQTELLRTLPEIMPPRGDWTSLERRLAAAGLLSERVGEPHGPEHAQELAAEYAPAPSTTPSPRHTRRSATRTDRGRLLAHRAAAAAVLFLGGMVAGSRWGAESSGPAAVAATAPGTVAEAAAAVRVAEQEYVVAVTRYRDLLGADEGGTSVVDPASRYAALEHLVLVSQAALRQAPADPFLNGFLASAKAERDAAARLVSLEEESWF